MNPLHHRLAQVRRLLWLVTTCRGLCWLGASLLAIMVAEGLLDWQTPGHLPAPVRALILVGGLGAGVVVAWRWLLEPLRSRTDDLSLALRIEARHPALNDSLASTVQFLEHSEGGSSSAALQQVVVAKTLQASERFNFADVVDSRGLRPAAGCLLLAGAAALSLIFLSPALATVAVSRLAAPYSGIAWPTQTHLQLIHFRPRIARGEPYDILCQISGVIPETGYIDFAGAGLDRQSYRIADGRLVAHLGRMDRPFRFTIHVNDAELEQSVAVEPPPMLAPLDGRASPQVHLDYPPYTDLPATDLPDGAGNIDAVTGTVVYLRAAADRPLAQAWLEYQPHVTGLRRAACLAFLGISHPLGVLTTTANTQPFWDRTPAQLGPDGQSFTIRFAPHTSGYYVLHFDDPSGLGSQRLFELHIFPDPAPQVHLERPVASRDSLQVLPDAEVPVQVAADDPQFALRRVALEYRTQARAPARSFLLYDHEVAGRAADVTREVATANRIAPPTHPVRLRPPHLRLNYRLPLTTIRHRNGKPLQAGDTVLLQATADDFDDVAIDKVPGRSEQVELHIVGRQELEQNLDRAQANVQQELSHLRKLQQDALAPVIAAEQRWRNTGRISQRDTEKLIQAQESQRQIREKIGSTSKDGVRGEVDRILRTLKDNHIPRSGTEDRMAAVATELNRLARKELPSIEPNMATARKDNENSSRPHVPAKNEKGPLGQARAHQEQVESTFNDLLRLMEPWGNLHEVQSEAQAIREQQRHLHDQTRDLDKHIEPGTARDALPPEQQTALDQTAEAQRKLQERTDGLLGKMSRLGQQREQSNPENARGLHEAAKVGRQQDLSGSMKGAADDLRGNQLNNALRKQQDSLNTLDKMLGKLEQERSDEFERLRKKLTQVEKKLADLTQQQEELRKKIQEAAAIPNAKQREQQLRRLARRQQQLRQQAQDMLRQLTRLRARQAGQALSDAADSMEQAGNQLSRGENPDQAQEETLDRLNEAQRRAQQARAEVEDELARERLGRVADQIKLLKNRQESANNEFEHLRTDALQNKGWTRANRLNLADLAEAQKGLGQETADLAGGKLANAKIFSHLLKGASDAMTQAADHLDTLARGDGNDDAEERIAVRRQRTALRRFTELLDALKSAGDVSRSRSSGSQGGQPQQGGSGQPDGIPQMAQLKVLRNFQAELNEETERFGKKHPTTSKLSAAELKQLQELRDQQRECADLLDELMTPATPAGGTK